MGKLIDADKLLDKARVGGNVTTYSELVEWIENGLLAPDPIPLPTIKPGDKVTHSNLGNVRVMELPTVLVLKDDQEYEVYLSDLEVSHD